MTLAEFEDLTSFFYRPIEVDQEQLLKKATPELVQQQLEATRAALGRLADWQVSSIESALRGLQEQHDWKKSQFFMMIRLAVTGRKATPPLFETIEAIGQAEVEKRLQVAQG